MNHVLDGDPDQPCKGAIFRGKDMPDDLLPWAVQRQLNWWRCCLGCGLWWAQGSMCYLGCILAQSGEYNWTVHVRQRCNLFVKLLWPLVPVQNTKLIWFY